MWHRTKVFLAAVVVVIACTSARAQDDSGARLPDWPQPLPTNPIGWNSWFKDNFNSWYLASERSDADPRPWGSGFDPVNDSVFAHNSMFIPNVGPRDVLAKLIRINEWSSFYPNSGVATTDDGVPVQELTLGLHYYWTTFSVRQHAEVAELVTDDNESILAWTGGSLGTKFYHRWLMRSATHDDGVSGTLVITEECQHGIVPILDSFLMNPSLHAAHELWLTGLKTILSPRP